MKTKRFLAVLMAAGMTLSLAACGSSSDSSDKKADAGSDSGKTYKIGILQQLEQLRDSKMHVQKSLAKGTLLLIFRTDRASRQTVQQSPTTS